MVNKIELLAPGGDIDAIKAAVLAGADAVYCGLEKFNARNRAANISFDDLQGILRLAHKNSCKVFLTLNILIVESELHSLAALLNRLVNTTIDGVIIQDPGMLYLLSNYFKTLKIHASTQLTTHNKGQIQFLKKLNVTRVNLSRELNIHEINALTAVAHQNGILTEVFAHGSYCISFSGLCFMSSVNSGNSANRGRCSQPCRDRYKTTAVGKDFPLNLKDNSAFFDLRELSDAGVDSLKIEGRIKKSDYVFTVVDTWRKQLDSLYNQDELFNDNRNLYKVFNRDFSNGFLKGEIHKNLFIDSPRDHSIHHLSEVKKYSSEQEFENDRITLFDEKEALKKSVEIKVNNASIAKVPLTILISGEYGVPLKVILKTPENIFEVLSEMNLDNRGIEALNYDMIFKRFKALNETEYYIVSLSLDNLNPNVYLPFSELTSLKRRLLFILNGSKKPIDPIDVPILKKQNRLTKKPSLSILISSEKDLYLCDNSSSDIYYQLPESIKNKVSDFISLFTGNKRLIPWFPSVLIGDDYTAAVGFLQSVHPPLIVTNNTGIAYEAYRLGTKWIAGPLLNIVNSFSLICLKENFNCSGSFISNELSKIQIQAIKAPDDFMLFYSIYQPILLMTSRQCLFHQVAGCERSKIDDSCVHCEKSATITNLKNETYVINKTKGNYHNIYNETNFLNTEIVTDLPDTFYGFCIDLSDIQTKTKVEVIKSETVRLFGNLLNGLPKAKEALLKKIYPTTNIQYYRGI